jgi:hypothetical protein
LVGRGEKSRQIERKKGKELLNRDREQLRVTQRKPAFRI